jgi:hypothetical protein
MKRQKTDYIVIGLGLVLLFIVFMVAFLALRPQPQETPVPRPTTAPTPAPGTEQPVVYNDTDEEKLLKVIQTRPPLSDEDRLAKANILSLLPEDETSGIVYSSSNISIEYVYLPDVFLVEILNDKFSEAKTEADLWFKTKGMSQQGICNAPVEFYVNHDVAEELRGKNVIFSTLPLGC